MAVRYDPVTWHLMKDSGTREAVDLAATAKFLEVVDKQLKFYLSIKEDLFVELEQDFEERVNLGVNMLKHYYTWAPTVDRFRSALVEQEFEVPIVDPDSGAQLYCSCHTPALPVFYQGRIDGLIVDEFGWYWLFEHKTARMLGDTNHLVLDEQVTSYAWAMQKMLGIQIKGIVYNEALKDYPKSPVPLVSERQGRRLSVNKMQRTTYDVYLRGIADAGESPSDYEDFLNFLKEKDNPFLRRTQLHRNQHELTEMGFRIYQEAQDMLDPNLRIYPNPSRINCGYCSFREPCIAKNQGADHEFLLRELYGQRG